MWTTTKSSLHQIFPSNNWIVSEERKATIVQQIRITAIKCRIFIVISKETTHLLENRHSTNTHAAHKVQYHTLILSAAAFQPSSARYPCGIALLSTFIFYFKNGSKWCAFCENAIDAYVRFRVLCALEKSNAVSFDLLRATQYVIVFGRFLHSWCILSHCQRPCSCTIESIWDQYHLN